MSNFDESGLMNVCRTCLSPSGIMKSLYQSSPTATNISLAEMLMSFTPLKCYENDGLPIQICWSCTDNVNRFHTFQMRCLESDGFLRNCNKSVVKIKDENIFVVMPPIYAEEKSFDYVDPQSCDTTIENSYITKSLKDPLIINDIQKDLDQELNTIKHEIHSEVKIEIEVVKSTSTDSLGVGIISKNDGQSTSNIYFTSSPNQNDILTSHIRKTNGAKPYSCTSCNETFELKSNLTKHIRKHIGGKPYACSSCDSSFNRKSNLVNHTRIHTGEKPYVCIVCGTSYSRKDTLALHLQTHTGVKPYSCTYCTKSYARTYHLAAHIRTHTGEKPYSCTECANSYNRKDNLAVHMRTHTGEEPYSCKFCDKSFSKKEYLTVHTRSHSSEKPFSCTLCDRSFTRKINLNVHIKTHTGE